MVAHLYTEMGMMELQDNKTTVALQHLQTSLKLSTELSTLFGEHILVTPLTLTANVLSTLGRYEEAFRMYKKALRLSEAHLGKNHSSSVALLVNFGIALVEGGDRDEEQAANALQNAIDIAEREDARGVGQSQLKQQVAYERAVEYLQIAQRRMNELEL
mmetsp:Transcript_13490/g.20217  ORF Transcript_13490/g.20217 Transcript_13490/m.20217 type:complete len:159 (-) Transcript_13490:1157-1633(-)|eukprot:CAMPEP_0170060930 /NCGR_PEP_ID=MMETSP0019_2-20121128/2692_1 /TAXON_ID=98059 /ORGANISM="Dinobryon sp., Strain UTEXLB2267" /LENGTH=158 /DNA_ID=CAMNT_0010266641 /DNA_START=107 /DNA_END=583 /DNA_ORIENTATION=+